MKTINIHHDKCCCGSKRTVGDCCLKPCGNLVPSRPITGYSHPDCYASASQDCIRKITREHYISRAVLRQLGDGKEVPFSGMPWQAPNDFQKRVPIAALQSKILCGRHNHALAALDCFAGRFFQSFNRASRSIEKPEEHPIFFHGPDVERWLIKVICGCACSGALRAPSGAITKWRPDRNWLNVLFRGAELRAMRGLYYAPALGANSSTSFSILAGEEKVPLGMALHLGGIPFILSIEEQALPLSGLLSGGIYRPREIQLSSSSGSTLIHLHWGIHKYSDVTLEAVAA